LQRKRYTFERHILPHDAAVRELGSGKSRTETLHGLGLKPTRTLKAHSIADGINATRLVLPRCWFDATKCQQGLRALRHYRREWNEAHQTWRSQPVHDFASHGADSFRYLAMGVRDQSSAPLAEPSWTSQYEGVSYSQSSATTGWMGI
jgi:hypothetical protein